MNFLDDRLSKNIPILDFMKIRLVETEFYHANRQKDIQTGTHDKSDSRF
jgi:hypothetical protein